MQFHTIITHESPDLDAILCCYLLKKYGAKNYPGIDKATITFCPAGQLPQGKSPSDLEPEGILAVDIGGGRFDTHPVGSFVEENKKSLSAANLVAKDLQKEDNKALVNLLEFTRIQDSKGTSLSSKNPIDHLVALPNLIRGALCYFDKSFDKLMFFFDDVFGAIEIAETTPKDNILTQDLPYLLAIIDKRVFLPPRPNFKNLFAFYLLKKYIDTPTEVHFSDEPPCNAKKWNTLLNFLEDHQLDQKPELEKLITFAEKIQNDQCLLNSNNPIDESVSLINIIRGFYQMYSDKDVMHHIFLLFSCAMAYEENWQNAIAQYKSKRQLYKIGNRKVVAVSAPRGPIPKVARWLDKADITIYRDEDGDHISISLNKLGKMKKWTFNRLAARLRIAETILTGTPLTTDYQELYKMGETANWFLHQSEKLLLHGSPKAQREPSAIPFEKIVELVLTEIDRSKKIPDEYCPPNSCTQEKCLFFPLRLANCFEHRRILREGNL